MKTFITWSLLFLFPCFSFAEKHYITLDGARLGIMLGKPGYFIEDIIDARDEKYCIGFVQKGMANKKVPAFFEKGLSAEFMGLFSSFFKKQESDEAIFLRVNHLFVYEVNYPEIQFSVAELNVSFLKKEGDAYIELLQTGTISHFNGMDATKKHAANIAIAVGNCLEEFKSRKKNHALNDIKIPTSEVKKNPLPEKEYNIETAAVLKKGLYRYFNDFRDNRPGQNDSYSIEYHFDKKKNVSYAEITWDNDIPKDGRQIWGFNDGKDSYVRLLHNFYKIKKGDKFFQVRAPQVKSGANTGAAIGGLLGAFIGSSILSESNNYEDYKLDFTTGALMPMEEPVFRKIESRLVLCSSQFNKGDKEISVHINGEKACALLPGQYQRFQVRPEMSEVEICVETETGKNCERIELELFKTKLYLINVKKKKPPVINHPSQNIRSEIAADMKNGKLTEICTAEEQ